MLSDDHAQSARHRVLLERAEELAGIGSWQWTPDTGELLWSDQLFRLYGVTPGSVTPSPDYVFDHLHPDDRERVQAAVAGLGAEGRLPPLEYRFVRPDGSVAILRATMATTQESAVAARTVIGSVQDVTEQRRAERELAAHAADQRAQARLEEALAEVAAAVAAGRESHRVVQMVAERAARALDAAAAGVLRFDGPLDATWLARTGEADTADRHVSLGSAPGSPAPALPAPASVLAAVARTGRPRRGSAPRPNRRLALGALWGCLAAAAHEPDRGVDGSAERLLGRFGALVSTALANAEARAHLERLATTDGLTGLANHRAFQEQLRVEHRRALRHGTPLALALFDVDGFKGINDQHGHQQGDRVLEEIGRVFAAHLRADDVAARIGGDEFAVIAPDSDAFDAYMLAERIRDAAARLSPDLQLPLTLSAGVAGVEGSEDPGELLRLADGALYWAKRHGRNMTVRYAPDVVRELSADERARRLEHMRALHTLRALARAVDAKDPSTREHSVRVADVAHALALRLGWPGERAVRLRDAAVLHDVGKIGVPDAILFKPGPLNPAEYEEVKEHAALGARIIEDVVDAEQVAWVRGHHERLDGAGYPDGLHGEAISDGARILAVADAFDSITASRPYKPPGSAGDALRRIAAAVDDQFDRVAVRALEDWVAAEAARPA